MSQPDGHTCPRCQASIEAERFYGPCPICREDLRSMFAGEARGDVAVGDYEPKMNVTPNAVALKDD